MKSVFGFLKSAKRSVRIAIAFEGEVCRSLTLRTSGLS